MKTRKNRKMPRITKRDQPPFDTSTAAVGRRIRQLREAHGLSQTRMAEVLGITSGGLSRQESGDNRMRLDYAMILCEKFGASLDWIYFGNPGNLSEITRKLLERGPASPDSSSVA